MNRSTHTSRVVVPALSLLALLCGSLSSPAQALEIEVTGTGSVNMHVGAPNDVKTRATAAAKKRATALAIDRVLGPDASLDPKISPKLDTLVAQIPDSAIVEAKSSRIGEDYQVTLSLAIEDKKFRVLLSDLGIALNTAAVRGYAVLAVMDEFLTNPRDMKAPLEELIQFTHAAGASYSDTSSAASAATASEESHSKAKVVGGAEYASDRGSGRALVQGSAKSDHTADATAVSVAQNNVQAEAHDNTTYTHLIKYQPQGGPEKTSHTYNALMGQLQDYDIRVLDNDVFKSKYFQNKPVTIEELQNSADLAKYVTFAKNDAKADFFMVGTSIIVDSGINDATGEHICSGVVTLKTYSTVDGESIASETTSESGAGNDLNDCAGGVAKKMAKIAGASLQSRISNYWKRRSTYGREYFVSLSTAQALPLMVRIAFSKAISGLPGVESSTQRSSDGKQIQLVVSYKGSDPLDQALAVALSANPAFATLDGHTEGNQVVFCMGPCAAADKP